MIIGIICIFDIQFWSKFTWFTALRFPEDWLLIALVFSNNSLLWVIKFFVATRKYLYETDVNWIDRNLSIDMKKKNKAIGRVSKINLRKINW